MNERRPPEDSDVSPAMHATTDRSYDTSRTAAPLESVTVRRPYGGAWAYVGAAVFIICVLVSLVLIFG